LAAVISAGAVLQALGLFYWKENSSLSAAIFCVG